MRVEQNEVVGIPEFNTTEGGMEEKEVRIAMAKKKPNEEPKIVGAGIGGAGGAMIGAAFGGPVGAVIGAGVSALIGHWVEGELRKQSW